MCWHGEVTEMAQRENTWLPSTWRLSLEKNLQMLKSKRGGGDPAWNRYRPSRGKSGRRDSGRSDNHGSPGWTGWDAVGGGGLVVFSCLGEARNSLQGGAESAVTSPSPAPEAQGPLRSSQGDRRHSEEKQVLRPCSAAPLGSRGWSGGPGRGRWGGGEGAGGEAVPQRTLAGPG